MSGDRTSVACLQRYKVALQCTDFFGTAFQNGDQLRTRIGIFSVCSAIRERHTPDGDRFPSDMFVDIQDQAHRLERLGIALAFMLRPRERFACERYMRE